MTTWSWCDYVTTALSGQVSSDYRTHREEEGIHVLIYIGIWDEQAKFLKKSVFPLSISCHNMNTQVVERACFPHTDTSLAQHSWWSQKHDEGKKFPWAWCAKLSSRHKLAILKNITYPSHSGLLNSFLDWIQNKIITIKISGWGGDSILLIDMVLSHEG